MGATIDISSFETIFWTLLSVIGILLMGLTYTYIDKLERSKCACAEHPYKDFIKKYIIFAICFLAVTAFLPPSLVVGMIGPVYSLAYVAVKWVYVIATIVFFVYALQYVRFLAQEKCKCSEDVRRDVLYWWSIVELLILSILVVLPFIVVLLSGSVSLAVVSGKGVLKSLDDTVMMTAINPISGAKKATSSFGKTLQNINKNSRHTMR